MRKTLVLAILIAIFQLKSQVNLVSNSGFEQFSSCPTFGAQWNVCTGWNNINLNTGVGFYGTPDYLNTCGIGNTAPPSTFAGTCSPQAGNAMMALVLYNVPYSEYREYIATQLTCPMQPGVTYTLSFWLSNGTGIISPWTIKNIGAHFSSSPLSQSGWNVINVVPQCEITTNVASTGWTQYTFTVIPTAVWNYLSFGSFRNDASNNPTMTFPNPGGAPSSYANYFVDEIKVLSPGTTLSLSSTNGNSPLCAGETTTISALGAGSYTWSTNANGSSIVVSPSVTTTYSVNTTVACGNSSSAITITVTPLPSLVVSSTKSVICSGQSATLTASGALNYTWTPGSTTSTNIVSPVITTNYILTGVDAQGCSNQTAYSLIVNPSPSVSINGPDKTICKGEFVTLHASGATTYSWNTGSTSSSITFTPSGSGTYSVTGTNTLGCSSSATFSVSVNLCSGLIEEGESGLLIYPSPFKNVLNLEVTTLMNLNKVLVLNSQGVLVKVFGKTDINSPGKVLQMDLGSLPAGIYFISVEGESFLKPIKVIKE